jgi:hypothetical protein
VQVGAVVQFGAVVECRGAVVQIGVGWCRFGAMVQWCKLVQCLGIWYRFVWGLIFSIRRGDQSSKVSAQLVDMP